MTEGCDGVGKPVARKLGAISVSLNIFLINVIVKYFYNPANKLANIFKIQKGIDPNLLMNVDKKQETMCR